MGKPTSRGRQKLEMKKIQNKTNLGVTFTKRRNGLFKKANELVTLCGVQLGMVIFSPGKKVYSFGHPNVYSIIDRFIYQASNSQDPFTNKYLEDFQKIKIENLYAQLTQIQSQAEIEKNNAKEKKEASQEGNIVEMPSRNELSYLQTVQLQAVIQELKARVSCEINTRLVQTVNNASHLQDNNLLMGDINGLVDVGLFNNFGAPGTSNLPTGPNYGSWNF